MMSGMGGGKRRRPGGDDGPGGISHERHGRHGQLGGMGGGGGMGGMGGMEGMGGMGGMMGGGGPPPDMGEVDGGSGDTKWKWEMKDDEIIVRIELSKPATKKDLKVTFGAKTLKVEVHGRRDHHRRRPRRHRPRRREHVVPRGQGRRTPDSALRQHLRPLAGAAQGFRLTRTRCIRDGRRRPRVASGPKRRRGVHRATEPRSPRRTRRKGNHARRLSLTRQSL